MPKFRVKGPDGRTYNVNAPEGTTPQAALDFVRRKVGTPPRQKVTLTDPGGRRYNVTAPAGMSQADIIKYVQKNKPKRTTRETIGDFLGDTVDNIFPNWGDEIAGAGEYVKAKVGITNKPPAQAYDQARARFRDEQRQYDREHPRLAWGSTITGTGIGLAAPTKGVAQGATRLQQAGRAAAVGAGYGAAAGAGEGTGVAERGVNAAKGAAIGGSVGAVIPSAQRGAGWLGRQARTYVPGVDRAATAVENTVSAGVARLRGVAPPVPRNRATEQADRLLLERMNEGHIITGPGQRGAPATPEAIADEVTRRNAMGVPAMPADTTQALRDTTSWAARGSGPGQTAVREALAARKATEGARVRQHVQDTMGPSVDPIRAVQDNLAASKAAAQPLYEEAYRLPTQITPEMAQIMRTPAFQEAIPQAVRNIENNMGNPRTHGFIPQPDGTFIAPAEGVLTTEGFDQVIRAMRESARGMADVNPLTGAVTHNTNSVHVNARAQGLQNELLAQNPPLRQAIEGYADEAAHREAMQAGGGVSKQTGHEINDLYRTMPADARPSYAQGARTALADEASMYGSKFPNGDTATAVRKSLGDDTKQAALEAIDGNRGAVPQLLNRLEAEQQGNIVAKEVLQGSKTADKRALDGQMDDDVKLTNFSVPGAARAAWTFLAEKASTPYRNEVKRRIAEVVTETNPANVREMMEQIRARAARDAEFADLLQKSGLVNAELYGRAIKFDGNEPTEE